ncbi:uncharacterized protein LOC108289413 [Cebus imitator]|uniref:uncharacterized protein LOC108289413 n=1 Tax=Cebus imitator TaxID=2715852 RepID=UPI000809BE5D|nr:uncharacterized protein LOC108289413 [Cebus imitator]
MTSPVSARTGRGRRTLCISQNPRPTATPLWEGKRRPPLGDCKIKELLRSLRPIRKKHWPIKKERNMKGVTIKRSYFLFCLNFPHPFSSTPSQTVFTSKNRERDRSIPGAPGEGIWKVGGTGRMNNSVSDFSCLRRSPSPASYSSAHAAGLSVLDCFSLSPWDAACRCRRRRRRRRHRRHRRGCRACGIRRGAGARAATVAVA